MYGPYFSVFTFLYSFFLLFGLLFTSCNFEVFLSRYTSHNFYRLAQSFRAMAMKGSEPWPQNLKYFQQELKIYCDVLHIFLKFFKKQKEQFYFQKFYRYIWQFIILADGHNNKNSNKKQGDKIFC